MCKEHYAILNSIISWSCWSVNFLKHNKEQEGAVNVSLNSDSIQGRWFFFCYTTCNSTKLIEVIHHVLPDFKSNKLEHVKKNRK